MIAYVYKYVAGCRVLYVGKTKRPLNLRINEHKRKSDPLSNHPDAQIYYMVCENEATMHCVENILIDLYRPVYNKRDMSESAEHSVLDLGEIEWHPYRDYVNPQSQKFIVGYEIVKRTWYETFDDGSKKKVDYCKCQYSYPELEVEDEWYLYRCCHCQKIIKGSICFFS